MSLMSPPPARPGARAPVRYSLELGEEICARIAAGESQRQLAGELGMPSRRCFRDWARRDPRFGRALAQAQRAARRARLAGDRETDQGRGWRRLLSRAGHRGGSVSIQTPELTETICRRIAAGESVLSIGADPAMPCAVSIYSWVRRDEDFREAYRQAKDIGSDMLFDLAREIALECSEATVRSDRLRVQTLLKQVALVAPRKYGGRDEDEAAEAPRTQMVVIQRFTDGSYADLAGNPIDRSARDDA